ncbi:MULTISPECIES: PDZ domain-containing protein [Sphingobacterium]|uniref:PDZ domain-containing protein n=1 Tax=Sphingobacterium TaxID=28453 RepID=UPI0013DB13AE|nr:MULTISPECIES: PDZ domain-containing protein [unclassified Sphingobacterium]
MRISLNFPFSWANFCFIRFFVGSLLILSQSFTELAAQHWIFKRDASSIVIPIDIVNHIIMLPVHLNGEELTFILDTGVKETMLFGAVDSIILKNVSSYNFQGLGVDRGIEGLLSLDNVLVVGDSALVDPAHDLYVIVDSTLNLSKNIGVPIHGILGSNFFQNHVVRIDYIKKRLHVFKSTEGMERLLRKYVPVKLDIVKDRPFIDVGIQAGGKRFEATRMLVDLGNSDPLMIFPSVLDGYVVTPPYVYEFLGQGFNGNIYGKRNRIEGVTIAEWQFRRLFVSYPDTSSYSGRRLIERRVGSVGNQIMARFDVVFDYADSVMYLRKNKTYSDPFNIDMSGLEVRHAGFSWLKSRTVNKPLTSASDQGTTINLGNDVMYQIELVPAYVIHHVRVGSPAFLAGVKTGDMVHKINGKYAGKMTLEEIKEKLQARDQYAVSLEVKRGEEIVKFRFKLIDPIPLN